MFPTIRCQNQLPNEFHQPESLCIYVEPVKSKVKISQNFVAFSEYMNFTASPAYHLLPEQRSGKERKHDIC